jgi:hypothetical protein
MNRSKRFYIQGLAETSNDAAQDVSKTTDLEARRANNIKIMH